MATIATQPQVGYRPGPRWMALFLVAAAGIGAGTVALVQTMTSEGVTAGRTAAVSSVDGAAHARALNQPEAALQSPTARVAAHEPAFSQGQVADGLRYQGLADRAAAEAEAVARGRVAWALRYEGIAEHIRPADSVESLSLPNGVIDARALNEPISPAASSVQAVEDLRRR